MRPSMEGNGRNNIKEGDNSARSPDFRCASIEKEVSLFIDNNDRFGNHEPPYPPRKNKMKLARELTARREHESLAVQFKASFNAFILSSRSVKWKSVTTPCASQKDPSFVWWPESCKSNLQMACQQTGKGRSLESSFNNAGLDEWERRVGRVKRFVWPQYLVEPQYIAGYFEGSRTA